MNISALINFLETFATVFRYASLIIIVLGFVWYRQEQYPSVRILKNILSWMFMIFGGIAFIIFTLSAIAERVPAPYILMGLVLFIIGFLLNLWKVGAEEQQLEQLQLKTSRFDALKKYPALFTVTYILWTICLLVIIAFLSYILYESADAIIERFGRWKFRIAFNLFAALCFLAAHVAWLVLFYRSRFSRSNAFDTRRRVISLLALITLLVKAGSLLTYPEYDRIFGVSLALIPLECLVYFAQEHYLAERIEINGN